MKRMDNQIYIEGRVYDHKLQLRTVQNKNSENFGKEFIGGKLYIATDEEGVNVVEVHYSYEPALNKNGKENRKFKELLDIIDGGQTWVAVGKDEAQKVKVTSAISLNDFYTEQGELVSAKRIESGFVEKIASLNDNVEMRATFKVQMVVTGFTKDEESETPKGTLKGAIFNFKNDLLPVSFTMTDPKGIEWTENRGFEPSEPALTEVTGKLISEDRQITIEKENAWGGTIIETRRHRQKEWLADGLIEQEAITEDSDDILTLDELKTAMQNRQVYLAEVKKRQDEYKANKEVMQAQNKSTVADVVNSASSKKSTEFDF